MENIIKPIKYDFISKKITILNILLSLLIVIYHADCKRAISYNDKDILYVTTTAISTFINLAVPTFFLISSFLFYRNFTINLYFKKIKSRFRSLFIPYIIWNTFYCIAFILCNQLPFLEGKFNSYVVFDLKTNLIGIIMSDYTPLWFVRDLMIFVIFSPAIYYLMKNKIIGALSIIALFILNACIALPYEHMLYWTPIYFTGAYISIHYYKKVMTSQFISRKLLAFIIILFTVYIIALNLCKSPFLLFSYRFISPICFWILIDYIFNYKSIQIKPFFHYAFFIYANHFFLLTGLQKVWFMLFPKNEYTFAFAYFGIALITIIVLIYVAFFIQKRFNKAYYTLTGGR